MDTFEQIKTIDDNGFDELIKYYQSNFNEKELRLVATISFGAIRKNRYKKFVSSHNFDLIMENVAAPESSERLRMPFEIIVWKNYLFIDLKYIFEDLPHDSIRVFEFLENEIKHSGISPDQYSCTDEAKKFVHYLNSIEPDVEIHEYKGKSIEKVRSGKIAHVVYVGRKFKSIKGLPKGIKIDKRFIVRGHFRKQPTKSGIKIIFIEPFYKGTDDMTEILKEYKVV